MSRALRPVLVAALALAFASPAHAAVTVGQLVTPNSTCGMNTILQTRVASGNSYVVPSAGVITVWSVQNGGSTIPGLKLKVGRPVAGSDYTIVGESVAGAQTPGVSTFTARIPVRAGDILGEFNTGGACSEVTSNADDIEPWVFADQAVGTTASFTPTSGNRLALQATVEPDADGDGFGDETQDQCPTDASTQAPCPAAPTPPPAAPPATPPPPTESTGSAPPPLKDTTAPAVSASIHRLLRLSKKGTISFMLKSSEQANATVTGTISLPKSKRLRFKTAKRRLAAHRRARITLKLSKHTLKKVRRALRHHRLKTKITITVKDAAGNKTLKRRTVRLRR